MFLDIFRFGTPNHRQCINFLSNNLPPCLLTSWVIPRVKRTLSAKSSRKSVPVSSQRGKFATWWSIYCFRLIRGQGLHGFAGWLGGTGRREKTVWRSLTKASGVINGRRERGPSGIAKLARNLIFRAPAHRSLLSSEHCFHRVGAHWLYNRPLSLITVAENFHTAHDARITTTRSWRRRIGIDHDSPRDPRQLWISVSAGPFSFSPWRGGF